MRSLDLEQQMAQLSTIGTRVSDASTSSNPVSAMIVAVVLDPGI